QTATTWCCWSGAARRARPLLLRWRRRRWRSPRPSEPGLLSKGAATPPCVADQGAQVGIVGIELVPALALSRSVDHAAPLRRILDGQAVRIQQQRVARVQVLCSFEERQRRPLGAVTVDRQHGQTGEVKSGAW